MLLRIDVYLLPTLKFLENSFLLFYRSTIPTVFKRFVHKIIQGTTDFCYSLDQKEIEHSKGIFILNALLTLSFNM